MSTIRIPPCPESADERKAHRMSQGLFRPHVAYCYDCGYEAELDQVFMLFTDGWMLPPTE